MSIKPLRANVLNRPIGLASPHNHIVTARLCTEKFVAVYIIEDPLSTTIWYVNLHEPTLRASPLLGDHFQLVSGQSQNGVRPVQPIAQSPDTVVVGPAEGPHL